MPMIIVAMTLPGSRPGTISVASTPALSSSIIQVMIPIFLALLSLETNHPRGNYLLDTGLSLLILLRFFLTLPLLCSNSNVTLINDRKQQSCQEVSCLYSRASAKLAENSFGGLYLLPGRGDAESDLQERHHQVPNHLLRLGGRRLEAPVLKAGRRHLFAGRL